MVQWASRITDVGAAQNRCASASIRRPNHDKLHIVVVVLVNINMSWRVWWEQCKAVVELDLLWHIRGMTPNIPKGVGIRGLCRRGRWWRWNHISARLHAHIVIEQGLGIDHHLCAVIKSIVVVASVRLTIIECAIGIMKMGDVRGRVESLGMSLLARGFDKCTLRVQVAP